MQVKLAFSLLQDYLTHQNKYKCICKGVEYFLVDIAYVENV